MNKQHNSSFVNLVKSVMPDIKEITLSQLKDWQQTNQPFQLIDVREESEWQQGFIPGAIHLSKGVIERDIEGAIPDKQRALVLYCGGGYRSALAATNLQKMGYTNILSLAGGYRAWQQAN